MIKINNTLGLGLSQFGSPRLFMPVPAAIAALASAAGSAASSIGSTMLNAHYGRESQLLAHKYNLQEMDYSQKLNREYQQWLNSTQYGAQVSGMRNAGLNPAGSNTSIGAMSGNSSLHSGGTGIPSLNAQLPNLGDAILQGLNAQADLDLKEAQKENTLADKELKEAQAADTNQSAALKEFQNSPEYRKATITGMNASILDTYASASQKESQVKVNNQTIVESAKRCEEIVSRIGVNEETKKKIIADTAETQAKIASIFQGIRESKSRVIFNYAAAENQRASARNQRSLAQLNEDYHSEGYVHQVTEKVNSERYRIDKEAEKLGIDVHYADRLYQCRAALAEYRQKVETYIPADKRGEIEWQKLELGVIASVIQGSGEAAKVFSGGYIQ